MNKIYDKAYYLKYVKQAKSKLGKNIYKTRWKLITKYIKNGAILDFGCGPGAFNKAGPDNFSKYGYDINPYCRFEKFPKVKFWDIVTFWDSLEHTPDFYGIIKKLNPKWIFLSCPNLESVKIPITQWKHYRPEEHLYYFDRHSLKVILELLGYQIVEINYDEGKLRDPNNPLAIITIAAKRIN